LLSSAAKQIQGGLIAFNGRPLLRTDNDRIAGSIEKRAVQALVTR
jgi:hypothetical protein